MKETSQTTIRATNRWDNLATLAVPRGHKEWPWFLSECERVIRKAYEDGFSAGVNSALRGVNEHDVIMKKSEPKMAPSQDYVDLVEAVRTYLEVQDYLHLFDGDKRGIASALQDKENVMRRLVGLQEIDNDER